jgi:hypothetical protein
MLLMPCTHNLTKPSCDDNYASAQLTALCVTWITNNGAFTQQQITTLGHPQLLAAATKPKDRSELCPKTRTTAPT